jgi:hypothetical protein
MKNYNVGVEDVQAYIRTGVIPDSWIILDPEIKDSPEENAEVVPLTVIMTPPVLLL